MVDNDLTRMAFLAVDADLSKMLHDRPEVTGRVSSGPESRFVHAQIRSMVTALQDPGHLYHIAVELGGVFDLSAGADGYRDHIRSRVGAKKNA
ncbi:hypothetical protein [Actinoplanes sp. NPDC020271]|uniref:hypothetical protein n=1 Tax=Actinoplanes sp. NPDC020271 TaxID=3363896 RepID=UPI0037B00EC3